MRDVREMEFLTDIFDKIKGMVQETIDFFISWWWLLLIIGVVCAVAPEVAKKWWELHSELKVLKRRFKKFKTERTLDTLSVKLTGYYVNLSVDYRSQDKTLKFKVLNPVDSCSAITSMYLEICEADSLGGANCILSKSIKFDVEDFYSNLDLSDAVVRDGAVRKSVPASQLFSFLSDEKDRGYYDFEVDYLFPFSETEEEVVKKYIEFRKDFKALYIKPADGHFHKESWLDSDGLMKKFFDWLYSSHKEFVLAMGVEVTSVPNESSSFYDISQKKYSIENVKFKL